MSDEKSTKKVTGRSSRQDIWLAYNELLEKTGAKSIEPKISDDKSGQKSLDDLSDLKARITRSIDQIAQDITTNLNSLDLAKEEVARERKRMFVQLDEQKLNLADEIKTVKRDWEREKTERASEEEEKLRKKTLAIKREEDEYRFNLERQRRVEGEKFEKEIDLKRAELCEQKEKLEHRKGEITEMERQIASYPTQTEKLIGEAVAQATGDLAQKHTTEIRELKLIAQGKEDLSKSQTANLEAILKTARSENESLKNQLAEATRQLKDMAVSAIESHSQGKGQGEDE